MHACSQAHDATFCASHMGSTHGLYCSPLCHPTSHFCNHIGIAALHACNLSVCLWLFNVQCVNTQHNYLEQAPSKDSKSQTSMVCTLPVIFMVLFCVLYGCFVLLDWIPFVGTTLSVVLMPIFFLIAAILPLGALVQLLLPVFIFPYAKASKVGPLVLSALQFLQQPARALGFFLLAYAPLALTALLLWGTWGTVHMMDRFSGSWWIALLQKSILIVLSGICLAPATLFLAIMGVLPARGTSSGKRSKAGSTFDRQRAEWFMSGLGE